MKYIKKFENFNFKETEYNTFLGVDVSDVQELEFTWTNVPHLSDYNDRYGKWGSSEKRIELNKVFLEHLRKIGIDKENLYQILIKNGLKTPTAESKNWIFYLKDDDLRTFFNIIENLEFII
jgi:hypothetical protein